jgi:aminopeptidase N
LADTTYEFGEAFAAATLGADPNVAARIHAARALAKEGSTLARTALRTAFEKDPSWGVLQQVAKALGKTHAPWAQRILIDALGHGHPKVRRAVADALGQFRSAEVADALLAPAQSDASYFVREAALHALGKTRDKRAFEVLAKAISGSSWNGTVESGAAYGLGELADERVTPILIEAAAPGKDPSLRRAALAALARSAQSVESERTRIVDAIHERLDDRVFSVQLSAIAAAEQLADPRFLSALDRIAQSGFDGRVRRDAAEAAIRIRESQKVPAQVTALRTDIDALRDEQRKLQEKIEAISRT